MGATLDLDYIASHPTSACTLQGTLGKSVLLSRCSVLICETNGADYSRTLVLNVWSADLEMCWKCRVPGPTPGLLNQNLHVGKIPRCFISTSLFEELCSEPDCVSLKQPPQHHPEKSFVRNAGSWAADHLWGWDLGACVWTASFWWFLTTVTFEKHWTQVSGGCSWSIAAEPLL